MNKYPLGDACTCWSLSDKIDDEISAKILALYQELKPRMAEFAILDMVPSYNALAVHFDENANLRRMERKVDKLIRQALARIERDGASIEGDTISIPVKYDGEDLQRVADLAGITVREVIEIHKASPFKVAMVGFKPHFPYLIGLDERIVTPRLDSPRTKIPAGSVAIGGAQTGIYPEESPGGWNLIGSTDPANLEQIKPGDSIIFKETA